MNGILNLFFPNFNALNFVFGAFIFDCLFYLLSYVIFRIRQKISHQIFDPFLAAAQFVFVYLTSLVSSLLLVPSFLLFLKEINLQIVYAYFAVLFFVNFMTALTTALLLRLFKLTRPSPIR